MTAACSFTCLRSCLDISNLKESRKENFQVGAYYYNCRGSKGAGVLFNMSLSNGRVAASPSFLFFIVQVFLHTGSFHVYRIHFVDPVSIISIN